MTGVSDLISRKCLKWKGMPEPPAREQGDKLPSDYFWTAVRFLSAQFLPLFDMRGSMNINHCFYHLLWKGSLCVWMAWKPQTCFSLCGITMSRKHFSQKESGGVVWTWKTDCVEGKLGYSGEWFVLLELFSEAMISDQQVKSKIYDVFHRSALMRWERLAMCMCVYLTHSVCWLQGKCL